MFLIMKYFWPALLLAGNGALLARNYSTTSGVIYRIPVQALFLLWSVFLLTVAEVKATDSHLEYRRLHKWRQIPYAAIRRCAGSLHPGLGFIELDGFRSRIYFVTLRPAFDHSSDVLGYVNERRFGPQIPRPKPGNVHHGVQGSSIKSMRLCLMMFLIGVIYAAFLTAWFPNFLSESNWRGSPPWMSFLMIFLLRAGSWPWSLLTGAALIVAIVVMRFQKRAWVLAMIVGSLIGRLAMQVWHS